MNDQRFYSRGVLIGLIIAGLIVIGGMFLLITTKQASEELPVLGTIPTCQFTERSGQPFGSMDLKGKVTIVDFIFTRCPGACPVMSGNMKRLYHGFNDRPDIQFVSISVDPEHDTLEVLHRYAIDQGVTDNRWVFLHAPIDSVVKVCEQGFMLPAENLPGGHSSKFVLVDKQGRIRGYYDGMDDGEMIELGEALEKLRIGN